MVQGEEMGGGDLLDNIAKVGGGHLVNSLETYIEGNRQPTGVPPCFSGMNTGRSGRFGSLRAYQ